MEKTLSILIVDDNPSNSISLVDILEVKGFEALAAVSGADALEILHAKHVDILLTDVKMPVMNGLELYRATRQNFPKLITIFMTAYAADELIRQGMLEGIRTVLEKPLDIDFLLVLLSAQTKLIREAGGRDPAKQSYLGR